MKITDFEDEQEQNKGEGSKALKAIDRLAEGKALRKTKERKIYREGGNANEDMNVRLPNQKWFAMDGTQTQTTKHNSNNNNNNAIFSQSYDATTEKHNLGKATESMRTSEVQANANNVFNVLDVSQNSNDQGQEPYRSIFQAIRKRNDSDGKLKKRKASLLVTKIEKENDSGGKKDDDDVPFIAYLDESIGSFKINTFSKNIPLNLGGAVVPKLEQKLMNSDSLLIGYLIDDGKKKETKPDGNWLTLLKDEKDDDDKDISKTISRQEKKKMKKEQKKNKQNETGVSHVVCNEDGYKKYANNARSECITKFVSPDYIIECLKAKKIIPMQEKWLFVAPKIKAVASAVARKEPKSLKEKKQTSEEAFAQKMIEIEKQNEAIDRLVDIAKITQDQAAMALASYGYSIEAAKEAHRNGALKALVDLNEQNLEQQKIWEEDIKRKFEINLAYMQSIRYKFMCQPALRRDNIKNNEAIAKLFEGYGNLLSDLNPNNHQMRGKGTAYIRCAQILEQSQCELTVNNVDQFIKTYQLSNRVGLGPSLIEKVKHVVAYGKLPEYDALLNDPLAKAVKDMSRVHGIGTQTALNFYKKHNLMSIADLRKLVADEDSEKKNPILTDSMRISLLFLEDLEERIPREEVEEIGAFVRESIDEIVKNVQVEIAGSYRRGNATCGDVDILVCLKENQSKEGVLQNIIDHVDHRGLIIARLTAGNFGQDNFMGIGKLPNKVNAKHRRIDIKVYEPQQFATALLYFTGSGRFNRSMRMYVNNLGWHLDDKGLYMDRLKSRRVFTQTEQDVFYVLGLDYVRPENRSVG